MLRPYLLSALAALACCSPRSPAFDSTLDSTPTASATDRTIVNLHAFARLYGYVRYFHPSDEASQIDWNKFAVHGAGVVKNARDRDELKSRLDALFAPVAPTVQILGPGEHAAKLAALDPEATPALSVVAWQHAGLGLGSQSRSYMSQRVGRADISLDDHALLVQRVPAVALRGKTVKLRGWLRAQLPDNKGKVALGISIGRLARHGDLFDAVNDAARSDSWQTFEVQTQVAEDAETLMVGVALYGEGVLLVDELELHVTAGKEWKPVALVDPDFAVNLDDSEWLYDGTLYAFTRVDEDKGAYKGTAVRMASKDANERMPFAEHARVGEVVLADIGDGLRCSVPLALWSKNGHTLGDVRAPLANLTGALARIPDQTSADDLDVRLGAVVVAWNVIQHFYPYFDVVDVDWNAVLDRTLADALDDLDARDFLDTMRRFVASYHDGHGRVMHSEIATKRATLPISVAWVEDALVVDASADQRVRVGDVITMIDGQPAKEWLAAREQMISGSPQRRRLIATWSLLSDDRKKSIDFEIMGADGQRRPLTMAYTFSKDGVPRAALPAAIRTLERGIYYVDLSRAPMSDIAPHLDAMAKAPGVIFDLRGYPKGNHDILTHLLPGPETARWMFTPQISRPDRRGITWAAHGWNMKPKAPRIAGKVVFLTDAAAISYAESVMGYVAGQKLGDIVGAATAGANGDANVIALPGGFMQVFTGMRVLQHDGARLHNIGVQPTVPAAPTIAGIRAGRDEVLETALSLVAAAQDN